MGANVGSVLSVTGAGNLLLIGSMANLIVAERAETRGVRIGFLEYARVGVPITLLTLAGGSHCSPSSDEIGTLSSKPSLASEERIRQS